MSDGIEKRLRDLGLIQSDSDKRVLKGLIDGASKALALKGVDRETAESIVKSTFNMGVLCGSRQQVAADERFLKNALNLAISRKGSDVLN